MKTEKNIPYKIYLDEQEMPKKWYNVRADMKNKPAPLLNPGTLQPMTAEELGAVFCDELVPVSYTHLDVYKRQTVDCFSKYARVIVRVSSSIRTGVMGVGIFWNNARPDCL